MCLQHASTSCFIIIIWVSSFSPLFSLTRSRGRCWAANRLSHHPEPPDCAPWGGRWIGHWKTTMVNGLICSTLTSHKAGHTPLVQAGAETSARHFCYCCQMNWLGVVQQVQMSVSIWDAVYFHSMDKWALSEADVQAAWHGVLEAVWFLFDEAQQVGCLRGSEDCPLV